MSRTDVCELFNRCLGRRDSGDWQEFVDRYDWQVRSMMRLTALRCGQPLVGSDLEDMVQELYCRLLAARTEGFRGRSKQELLSYLSQAVYSLVVDRRRSLATRKRRPNRRRPAVASRASARRSDPEEQLLGKERRQLFFERCLEIARCDRVVVELRALKMALLEGWSSREIARQLEGGLNAKQVDNLVARLRRHLAKDGILLPRRPRVTATVPA